MLSFLRGQESGMLYHRKSVVDKKRKTTCVETVVETENVDEENET